MRKRIYRRWFKSPLVRYLLNGERGEAYERILAKRNGKEEDAGFNKMDLDISQCLLSQIDPEGRDMRQMLNIENADDEIPGIERTKIEYYKQWPNIKCMLIKQDGIVAEYLFYQIELGNMVFLNTMVHPEYRKFRIATLAIERLKDLAVEEECMSIIVDSMNGNDQRALELMRTVKFTIRAIFRDIYGDGIHGYRMIYRVDGLYPVNAITDEGPAIKSIKEIRPLRMALEQI